MGGQIVDASLIAPKQRNTDDEKTDPKEGHIPKDWKARPAKLRQKDRDCQMDGQVPEGERAARRHEAVGRYRDPDLWLGLIREWQATDTAVDEGASLREGLLDTSNTTSTVWADTADCPTGVTSAGRRWPKETIATSCV